MMDDKDKILDCTKPIKLPDDCSKAKKNFTQGYFYREIGQYNNSVPFIFQWAAEDKLINKGEFEELKCQLPDSPRSTFLMVFSPDGKKVASTHGNHNVYVTDLTTGKNIQTLSGHPRTPWCIAFHPSSNQILASGCLGGQVRVWDLQGRSEVWTAESQTVIASLAFHPVDRMLVIATYNELHFWDWSKPEPFAKCSTKSEREKVRYVSFDRLGNKLITGIANPVNVTSQWDRIKVVNNQSSSTTSTPPTTSFSTTSSSTIANTQSSTDQGRSITFCYRHLMNQYNQLVNRYLNLSRSRITPMTDRGTDPMDLLDLRNNGNTSESNLINPSPSTSNNRTNFQASSSSSPLRFKITGSGSRASGNRRKFQFLSSPNNRFPSRHSLNSFVFTTSSPSIPHSIFSPSRSNSPITSTSQPSSSRRCALAPTTRSWCLTLAPENSPNLFSTRNTSRSSSVSGAITNPTYTSYSSRGIFSTRETGSNHSTGSQFSTVCPYRMMLDDIDDHRLTIHRAVQSNVGEPSSYSSSRTSEISNNLSDGCDRNTARRNSDSEFCSSNHTNRERQRSFGLNLGRYKSDSRNLRHLREQQSQLRLITNRETHGLDLQNNQNLRRQLSFRPKGQFVLSRHSNSPFQPRIPQQVNTLTASGSQSSTDDASFSKTSSTPKPEMSSLRLSSLATSSRTLNSAENTSSTSSNESSSSFSPDSATNSPSFSNLDSSNQLREQIKTRLFDRVERMLRDRMRNSSHIALADNSGNYSQVSGEAEEVNVSRGLGPRGADPMLSSASDYRDASNDGLLMRETSPDLHSSSNATSENIDNQHNESEILNLWESEASQFSLNSSLPIHTMLEEQSPNNRESGNDRNVRMTEEETEMPLSSTPINNSNNLSLAEYNMREGIQRLSLHIEGMQVLCRARIEILQREKIRGMWENLTNQIRQFQNAIQSRSDSETTYSSVANPNSDNSNSSTDLPSLRDLAISSSPLSDSSFHRPSTSSNYINVVNGYKELLESMVNELCNEVKKSKMTNDEPSLSAPSTSKTSEVGLPRPSTSFPTRNLVRSETEEPQPGPSGVRPSTTSKVIENMKQNFNVKLLIETLRREKRKRRASRLNSNASASALPRSNHFLNLRHSPREFRRSKHGPDYFTLSSRAIKRLHDLLKSKTLRPSTLLVMNNSSQTSISSFGESSNSNDACQSCGQKKNLTAESNGQKRRNKDSAASSEASGSASKISKNNTGERKAFESRETEEPVPSTSTGEGASTSTSQAQATPTNELLNQMIQTMVIMLRFLREAFARTGQSDSGTNSTESQSMNQQPKRHRGQRQEELPTTSLVSSGDDSDECERNNVSSRTEQFLRDLPGDFRRTKKLISDLMGDVTQFRAKKLLGFTVKCLTQFFGKNFGNLIQVLDEQFLSLYKLLHLAMELTELLLSQLNCRRDLERTLEDGNLNIRNTELRTRSLLLPRSHASFSRRDRFRSMGRNLPSHSYDASREDLLRCNESRNPFSPSCSRLRNSRLHHSYPSANMIYDRSSTFISHYGRRRRRRRTTRMSTTLPSGWANRKVIGLEPSHSLSSSFSLGRDTPSNGHSTSNLRNFRFGRRSSEYQSRDIRAFNYDRNGQNNNSDNRNINFNDTNNNFDSNNLRNSDIGYYGNSNDNSNESRIIGNNNNDNINNNDNSNINNSNNSSSNFYNHFVESNSNSNADSSSNNIIIVTDFNSNDAINTSENNRGTTNTTSGGPTRLNESSIATQNSVTPLRSMELTLSRSDGGDLSLRDERPIFWIRYGGGNESSGSSYGSENHSRINTFTVPVVQVNDVPVSDVTLLNQPRHRPQSPIPRGPDDIWRWRAWRPRLLHPRNSFEDHDSNDVPENIHYYRLLSTSAGSHLGVYALDPIIADAPLSPRHRIQAWDFSKMNIPDISDREANGVVPECKIHNDASVDVSNDGHLLVTLLPAGRLSVTTMLGVYSLDWSSLGQLLYRTSFEQNAVSVSLSPTNRHLLVGLASRPVVVRDRTNMAQIFRLEGGRPSPNGGSWQSGRGRLVHMRDLEQTRETNMMSLNCIRWAPGAGQGLVYGTNTGQLKVLR